MKTNLHSSLFRGFVKAVSEAMHYANYFYAPGRQEDYFE